MMMERKKKAGSKATGRPGLRLTYLEPLRFGLLTFNVGLLGREFLVVSKGASKLACRWHVDIQHTELSLVLSIINQPLVILFFSSIILAKGRRKSASSDLGS